MPQQPRREVHFLYVPLRHYVVFVAGFAVLDGFLASVDCCMNNVDFCYLTAQT
jgi:hypothetical protein